MYKLNKTITAGSTVRLSSSFVDFDNNPVNPQVVKVSIYNYRYEKDEEKLITLKNESGEYVHNFVTDIKPRTYIVEWYGEIDGHPSIHRENFSTKQMSV